MGLSSAEYNRIRAERKDGAVARVQENAKAAEAAKRKAIGQGPASPSQVLAERIAKRERREARAQASAPEASTTEDTVEDYADVKAWTKKTLGAEIDKRNTDRAEADLIVPEGTKRDDLVAALLADDAPDTEEEA